MLQSWVLDCGECKVIRFHTPHANYNDASQRLELSGCVCSILGMWIECLEVTELLCNGACLTTFILKARIH
jgi:hypothetical protein